MCKFRCECLRMCTAGTIRGLVHDWLDAEGLDIPAFAVCSRWATLAWHALEQQEARQVRERAPQHWAAARQHALTVHQAVLAYEHTRCQHRPRRERRRDLLPPLAGASDRVGAAAASNKLSCRATRGRPRHSRSLPAWTVARWTCWCRSCTWARQTPSCRSSPCRSTPITSRQRSAGRRRPRPCSSRPPWTT